MAHQIKANLSDLKALATAVKDLEWYTGAGGYLLAAVTTALDGTATWSLESRPAPPDKGGPTGTQPNRTVPMGAEATSAAQRRRMVEPGDQVVVETKAQQMARRLRGTESSGVEGTVFRVLTRGLHPHGMKVELRDGTVGRVQKNVTAPGAGEPQPGRR